MQLPYNSAHTEIEKIYISNKISEKILRRMVFLHNNLMQYYAHNYREVLLIWQGNIGIYKEPIIYFKSTGNNILQPNAQLINSIIANIIHNASVTQTELRHANEIWDWLRTKVKIDLPE